MQGTAESWLTGKSLHGHVARMCHSQRQAWLKPGYCIRTSIGTSKESRNIQHLVDLRVAARVRSKVTSVRIKDYKGR